MVLISLSVLVSACGSQPARTDADRPVSVPVETQEASRGAASAPAARQASPVANKAARIALQQLGTPYRYGGASPSGFDCSGLVQYSYSRAGASLPRTTGAQWSNAQTVPATDMRVGDLLFFEFDGKMSHVGIYIGERKFVHAPSSGKHVSVASLKSDYYRDALLRVGRPRL